jgi:hypothetical protein
LPFEKWLQVFPDEMAAAAVIDRRLKVPYGLQTQIMAKIVQEKLAPKQARGMRR